MWEGDSVFRAWAAGELRIMLQVEGPKRGQAQLLTQSMTIWRKDGWTDGRAQVWKVGTLIVLTLIVLAMTGEILSFVLFFFVFFFLPENILCFIRIRKVKSLLPEIHKKGQGSPCSTMELKVSYHQTVFFNGHSWATFNSWALLLVNNAKRLSNLWIWSHSALQDTKTQIPTCYLTRL